MPDEPMLVRVINDLADQTPYTKEGRTRLLIEQQLPELTVLQDLEAMHRAPSGESLYNTFHAQNWANKPHRVLYDALAIARKQNAELTAARARIAKLEEVLLVAGKQFQFYAEQHLQKEPSDIAKATIDDDMATLCFVAHYES